MTEGSAGDEPGSAEEAYELLVKHGYHLAVSGYGPPSLFRPDESKVSR